MAWTYLDVRLLVWPPKRVPFRVFSLTWSRSMFLKQSERNPLSSIPRGLVGDRNVAAVTSRGKTQFWFVNHQMSTSFGLFVFKVSLSLALESLEHGQDEFNKNIFCNIPSTSQTSGEAAGFKWALYKVSKNQLEAEFATFYAVCLIDQIFSYYCRLNPLQEVYYAICIPYFSARRSRN